MPCEKPKYVIFLHAYWGFYFFEYIFHRFLNRTEIKTRIKFKQTNDNTSIITKNQISESTCTLGLIFCKINVGSMSKNCWLWSAVLSFMGARWSWPFFHYIDPLKKNLNVKI